MKKNLLLLSATLFLFTGLISMSSCGGPAEKKDAPNETNPVSKDSTKATAYVCPMGDGGGSDSPGKCPKCGMDLVKNEKALK